jgi:hypothetical protein
MGILQLVLYGTLRITIGNSKHSDLHIQIKNKWTNSTSLSSTPFILTPHSYAQSYIKMQVLMSASIAQMVKALECYLKVVSSNPEGGKFFQHLFDWISVSCVYERERERKRARSVLKTNFLASLSTLLTLFHSFSLFLIQRSQNLSLILSVPIAQLVKA